MSLLPISDSGPMKAELAKQMGQRKHQPQSNPQLRTGNSRQSVWQRRHVADRRKIQRTLYHPAQLRT